MPERHPFHPNEPLPLLIKHVPDAARYRQPYVLFDQNGWCRGGAATLSGAEELKAEIEAGITASPILDPVWRP